MQEEPFPGEEGAQEQSEGEYIFELEEGEQIVAEFSFGDVLQHDPQGIRLVLTKEDAEEDDGAGEQGKNVYHDVVHRILFTNKKMACFLGAPADCTVCSSQNGHQSESGYCKRGLYAEYFNCTTHGASAESRTFMITMSDVVLAEQLEMNPQKDCTENLEEAEEAFKDVCNKEPYVVGLLGEFSLTFTCTTGQTAEKLYELFGRGNLLCDDPEEVGTGMLDDLEDEDEYAGMTEEEVEQRMIVDMKQAAEELVNDQGVMKKRDPLKPGEMIAEPDVSALGDKSSTGETQPNLQPKHH